MESRYDLAIYLRSHRVQDLVRPLLTSLQSAHHQKQQRFFLFRGLIDGVLPLIQPDNPRKLLAEISHSYNLYAGDLLLAHAGHLHLQRVSAALLQITDPTGPQIGVVELTETTPAEFPMTWKPEFVTPNFRYFAKSSATGQTLATHDLLKKFSQPHKPILALYPLADLPQDARKITGHHPHFHLPTNCLRIRLCLEYLNLDRLTPTAKLKVFSPFSHGETIRPNPGQPCSS